jgi:SAM-dependent methyltransferase
MSMNWQFWVALQAVKARLPFADALRRLKRRNVGYRPHSSNIGSTVDDLARLYALLHAQGGRMSGTVLEVGTGWFPISGILARLAGAERVILTDITPHMDAQTFATARDIVAERLDALAPLFGFDADAARATLAGAGTPGDLGLEYHAPFCLDDIPDRSVDVIISRACLEHIPVPDLRALMAGLRGKLRDDGVMMHAIDNGDHLAQVDRGISRLNFLTWTERKHALIGRLMCAGENRLRHRQYATLFQETGYRVVGEDRFIHEPTRQQVESLALVPPYDTMTEDELATVTSWFVLRSAA